MIVFWRLLLAYYICAALFYNRPFFAWRNKQPVWAHLMQGSVFALLGAVLTKPWLGEAWPLAELWQVPGWVCLLILTAFYMYGNYLFVFRTGQTKRHALTFIAHDASFVLALFLCVPLHMLYHTGNFLAEPWTISIVGLFVVTKMFSVFIYMVEQDLYGRDYPTIDESFITMLMRLIFYLIMLLPGWRWAVWFFVWLWACQIARKNRLMDFSRFALYFSAFGAAAVGLLAKWSFYLQ